MRLGALIAVLLGTGTSLLAQTRNGVYFELGGSGVVPTINYERRLNERWLGRVGFSWIVGESDASSGNDTDTSFIVPLTITTVRRPESNHHLELGGGITIAGGDRQDLFNEGDYTAVAVTGLVGYRYQKPGGGFQFRSVFTPLAGNGGALPWFGVSFGYAW